MSENEKLEELEMQIENLKGKKNYIEESIAELELHHKKQRLTTWTSSWRMFMETDGRISRK